MKRVYIICFILFVCSSNYAANILNVRSFFSIQFKNNEFPSDVIFIDGNVYILESKSGKLIKIDMKKKEIVKKYNLIDSEGSIGVTFYKEKLFVPIPNKNKINVYSFKNLKKLKEIYVIDPTDIEFYRDKGFVVSNDKHKLIILDAKTLKRIGDFGNMGYYEREFRYPFDLEIDKNGDLYISEVINTRVQILDNKLRFVNFVGKWGVKSGTFYRPKGIDIYNDYLIVADGYIGVIQFFNKKNGDIVYLLGVDGKLYKFLSPVRVRVFKDFLGIVDYYQKKVLIFKLGDISR
ncbi:hypothetical protein [Deferribacter abyssi]|uniref:hypothetical protein n=1 Tax=Deferribacter abyssi TaxID=213806 RepID=UPI003C156B27